MDLTVVTVCENDKGLLADMVESVRAFTPFHVPIIIVHNGGSKVVLQRILKKYSDIQVIENRPKSKNTSYRHGEGLNLAMTKVKTKFTAIVESDCIVLSPNWYNYNAKKYLLSAAHKGKRDIDYWYIFFLVFKTNILRHMDWRPISQKPKYGDAGWRMYHLIDMDKIEPLSVKAIKAYKSAMVFRDGKEIAAHFGRGSDLNRRGLPKVIKHDLKWWHNLIRDKIQGYQKILNHGLATKKSD